MDAQARTTEPTSPVAAIVRRARGLRRYWPLAAALLAVIVGWMVFGPHKTAEPYRTAPIDQGAITRVVSATGTLEPIVSANVGSLVSAPVKEILVDFNSRVTEGQVLARLDPTTFQQRIVQAQAGLAQAQAQAAVANADYQRYERLNQSGFASEQLMNQQRAARDTARAAVAQASAQLAAARTDLDRATIRSPINGVVVDRQVNVGQVVQSSFSAATLFTIAQDLSRLQANITVDEADIGEVREGMPVRFTVDAFPDTQFQGAVSQVRQQGVSDQGVVSYTVVVQSDNPGMRLKPGMTANAEIIVQQVDNVLRLPNAALRFRPSDPALAARGQALAGGGEAGAGQGQGRREGGGPSAQGAPGQGGGQRGQGGGAGRGVNQLAEALQLTDAQKAQATEAFQQEMAAAGGFQAMGDMPQDQRRALFRRIREAVITRIQPSLTPHQQELLAQMRSGGMSEQREVRRRAVVWVLRNGQPTPIQVTVGVADDGHTALVGGDLKAGDEVIIGGGPRNDQQQQRGPMGGGPMGGGVRIRGG
ncbi:MAG TPA: efflux RND transporter periplasmic adaptor subunit [Caulobacterales bacterium]|nr:efflux RND transporter periplasmic adaptor subunit [Caulobacterales bacterium]